MYTRTWAVPAVIASLVTGCVMAVPPDGGTMAGPAGPFPVTPAGVPNIPDGTAGVGQLRASLDSVVLVRDDARALATLVVDGAGRVPTSPLVWTSSDDKVATVHPLTGQVKAIAPGTATVSASLQADPNVKALVTVNVVEQRTVVLLKVKPERPTMQVGDKEAFTAEVYLADGQVNGNVAWSSSDDTIATVNATTGAVSALREGRVTIVAAYLPDPRYKGLAEVTIVKDRAQVSPSPSPSPVVFGPGATPLPALPSTEVPNPKPTTPHPSTAEPTQGPATPPPEGPSSTPEPRRPRTDAEVYAYYDIPAAPFDVERSVVLKPRGSAETTVPMALSNWVHNPTSTVLGVKALASNLRSLAAPPDMDPGYAKNGVMCAWTDDEALKNTVVQKGWYPNGPCIPWPHANAKGTLLVRSFDGTVSKTIDVVTGPEVLEVRDLPLFTPMHLKLVVNDLVGYSMPFVLGPMKVGLDASLVQSVRLDVFVIE